MEGFQYSPQLGQLSQCSTSAAVFTTASTKIWGPITGPVFCFTVRTGGNASKVGCETLVWALFAGSPAESVDGAGGRVAQHGQPIPDVLSGENLMRGCPLVAPPSTGSEVVVGSEELEEAWRHTLVHVEERA